jgi:hypothetical protein
MVSLMFVEDVSTAIIKPIEKSVSEKTVKPKVKPVKKAVAKKEVKEGKPVKKAKE